MTRRRTSPADFQERRRRTRRFNMETLEDRTLLDGGLSVVADDIGATARAQFWRTFASITDDDPNASFVAVSIDWGDGSTDSTEIDAGSNVAVGGAHTYQQPGTYTVTLSASDSDGNSATASATATVNAPQDWGCRSRRPTSLNGSRSPMQQQ